MLFQNIILTLNEFFQKYFEETIKDQEANKDFNLINCFKQAFAYVTNLSEIDDENVFKTCADFWTVVSKTLKENNFAQKQAGHQNLYGSQVNTVEQEGVKSLINAFNVLLL